MIFISSKIPFAEIEILTPNEIRNKTDWFLFDCQIRNKKYWKDDNLYHMYNRLYWYPIFYKDKSSTKTNHITILCQIIITLEATYIR